MAEPHDMLRRSLADRYDIERELGEGGMATVYLAHDVRHARKVAIKVIRPEIAETLGTERFLSEITLTASLRHPHILALLDSGVVSSGDSRERPFYVMPYITGETLRARLARQGGEAGMPAWVLVQLGDTATARKLLRDYEAAREHTYVAADALAAMYAALGDSTRALDLLDTAAEERAFTLVFIANYPMFNSFHNSARFRRLVDRIGVVPPA